MSYSTPIIPNPSYTKIQLRNDLAVNWTNINPILNAGEIGVEIDTLGAKVGNGIDAWVTLPYLGSDNGLIAGTGLQIVNSVISILSGVVDAIGTTTANQVPVTNGTGGYSWQNRLHTYAQNVGDGTTTAFNITHNLNTTDVMTTVVDLTTNEIVYPTITIDTVDEITVTFSTAPTTDEMRILVTNLD